MFTVDRESRRTLDTENGCELENVRTFRDGTHDFLITCPSGSLQFSAAYRQKFDGESESGKVTWFIKRNLKTFGSISIEESRELIRSSLKAFKVFKGVPEMAIVEIEFNGDGEQ